MVNFRRSSCVNWNNRQGLDGEIHTNSQNQSFELFEFLAFGLLHGYRRAFQDAIVELEYTWQQILSYDRFPH